MKPVISTFSDQNQLKQARALFSNIYWHGNWSGDYLLLTDQIDENNDHIKWFRKVGIHLQKADPVIDESINSKEKLYSNKLNLFSYEMKKWKNVVYLDTDVLIGQSLSELENVSEFSIVQGRNLPSMQVRFSPKNEFFKRFSIHSKVGNGGVFCFPTKIINEKTIEEFKDLHNKYSKNYIQGGVPENLLAMKFSETTNFINKKYNTFPHPAFGSSQHHIDVKSIKFAHILHFIGLNKCWSKWSLFYRLWKRNLEKSEDILTIKNKKYEPIEWLKEIKMFV